MCENGGQDEMEKLALLDFEIDAQVSDFSFSVYKFTMLWTHPVKKKKGIAS